MNGNDTCCISCNIINMQDQASKKKKRNIDTHYLSNFAGPILITAPHSKKLIRKEKSEGVEEQVHLRQKFIGYIAMKIAKQSKITLGDLKFENSSFVIWGKEKVGDDPDPNYLAAEKFSSCVFHNSLHFWAEKYPGIPIFHIDMHGKVNDSKKCEIDVGTKAMKVHLKDGNLVNHIISFFDEKLNKKMNKVEINGKICSFNAKNPRFSGLWGKGIYTMSQQSAQMLIPSIQLQIPGEIRQRLFEDKDFAKLLASCLTQVYLQVIVPYFMKNPIQKKINHQFSKLIKETAPTKKFIRQCLEQQRAYQLALQEKNNPEKIPSKKNISKPKDKDKKS